jgi:hypothetical protein
MGILRCREREQSLYIIYHGRNEKEIEEFTVGIIDLDDHGIARLRLHYTAIIFPLDIGDYVVKQDGFIRVYHPEEFHRKFISE